MKKITTFFILMGFLSISISAQISESFEGDDFPPEGWATFLQSDETDVADSEWEISDLYSNFGKKSAYSDFADEETYTWLVTPQYTPTNENHTIFFQQRQFDEDDDWGSEYSVRVTTGAQDDLDGYITLIEHDEEGFGEEFSADSVDLSDFIDTPIYIAFVHYQWDGDNWYIDDVRTQEMTPPEATINPIPTNELTDVEIVNSQTSIIDFSWEINDFSVIPEFYDFYIGADSEDLSFLGSRLVPDAHPHTFHFNTTYYWKAAAANSGGEAVNTETWSFTTVAQPTFVAPYTIDFENEGYITDGCDQLITNQDFWKFSNDLDLGHVGNDGDVEGTSTESGEYFAYVDDSSPNGINTSFLTPFIDVSTLNHPGLSFYMLSNCEDETNVDFEVFIFTGTDWVSVFESNTNTAGWEKKEIDISLVGFDLFGPIQAKFVVSEVNEGVKDDLAIDDIKFFDLEPDNVNNVLPINGLSYFPNPVKNQLSIRADEKLDLIEVFNVEGKKVVSTSLETDYKTINTEMLNSGTYLVVVKSNNKTNSFKIIVEK